MHEVANRLQRDPSVAHDLVSAGVEGNDTIEDAGVWGSVEL
jgi:hypothetical protein